MLQPIGAMLLLSLAATAELAVAGAVTPPLRRVRPLDAFAAHLVVVGTTGSPTFVRLLNDVERSGLVVYVTVRSDGKADRCGRLQFAGARDGRRYLRIQIDTGTSSWGAMLTRQLDLAAILGHELQHVLEVAANPSVDSLAAFEALYRRIGLETRPRVFETIAAHRAGRQILWELRDTARAE